MHVARLHGLSGEGIYEELGRGCKGKLYGEPGQRVPPEQFRRGGGFIV